MDKLESKQIYNPFEGFEIDKILGMQPFLSKQNTNSLLTDLTPLTYKIMSRQSTINVGVLGGVAQGKTTLVENISGVKTIRFKNEKERNITYNLGYANAKLFKCDTCPIPECFQSFQSEKEDILVCDKCKGSLSLKRHVSFVDCPGYDIVKRNMLIGTSVMDQIILITDVYEPFPQTSEYLDLIEVMNKNHINVLENKVDLLNGEKNVKEHYDYIRKYVDGSRAQNSPIIPISAKFKIT